MGCKFSILEYVRGKVEEEKSISSGTNSSLVTSDATETDTDQDSLFLASDKYHYIAEEDVQKVAQRKTDALDIVAEKDEKTPFEDNENGDYLTIKGPQDFSNYLLTNTVPSIVKILLVFSQDDQQMEILANTARRLGWSVSLAKDAEKAVELFQNRAHELVIIDHRGHHAAEGDAICRAIRSSPVFHNSVIIALVKKSYFMLDEKDHIVALNLLETGFTRALMECSHEGILINELVGIYTSSLLPKTQLAAAHALYLALDRCRDMVHVTNDKNIVQFLNKVSEKLLGYKTEEMMGINLSEIVYYENSALMEQQLSKGREFEGNMNCKRKNNQMITINCRIIPFCITLKKPSHYIYVYDTTYLSENSAPISPVSSPLHPPLKTSILSNTRKSSDVRSGISEGRRRSSLQKLNTLQLEAPITKVITLLSNAVTDTTNPETAAQIDKAIDILKTTELYVPHLKEDRAMYSDPVATDLVGALLASPRTAWESRRSSSDSARVSTKAINGPANSRAQVNTFRGPQEITEILDKSLDWDFEIFKLEVLTEKRPLVFLGLTIMNLYQVPATLHCDERTLQNWLAIIEHNYNEENSYHNSTHAADVMQATARFMQSKRLKEILEPIDEVAVLVAAAAHDIDHPGRSSQFLCNASSRLAILYNDLSVLESHHAALTFKLSLSDDSVNIFKNLERDAYKLLRQNVIDMILATEMTKHFEHLAKFMNVCSARIGDGQETYSDSLDMSVVLQPDNVILIKRMMIKCADVSNPTRPLKCCVEWARRIAKEYFNQTDEEKKLKMPVVMPMFDRMTCSIPKSQIGFVDYIINDMIEAWDVFIDMPELVGYMRHNYEKWKEYNEQGISTLQDVEKLQQHPEMQIPRL
ncbi:PREDICTED: high affinity cAMP-specific and IBMX-insensitive 3',5'-cyclic phosphodiesterase 8A isoform X1 [Wasmannia auropunctata]|uniref:high affinity cAMP-specific and IBMX-insensitive 3',5'-cyclic phosphodiesterase 8A isoform X1 n=1 Tax=Wasmannia auropunctata TaxID=64793 RepID=UPI0005F023A3|nr:PREDICTED: high affinity cAMP-specific and IBMX-insensitive 3',5'-cyclic phosphodiesterase 8A isoform X1 [Wasmannia auropunctata]XP_011684364.1 PREDICTED: high affinity cAMP-specific and IBMX-insensitive 3',5'-cyclic phosphodiesterase 8A isoform X1 [Wasmannia auropunctata]XP_011684365.1 PREDICTED: high affinity cAMP-specific and IBMX-insensitive 3',5'-cyclic phosphodiesterase 8A isoform X1 [Wasmannia auropunctata]XP_011684366.1 PREDICTED: high affinity cAMP-specific and IBMX-insensitive 3',5'